MVCGKGTMCSLHFPRPMVYFLSLQTIFHFDAGYTIDTMWKESRVGSQSPMCVAKSSI